MRNIFLLILILSGIAGPAFAQNRFYVSQTATGQNNGQSWTDAFTDLHQALAIAQTGDELWVAEGEYCPDTATNRDRSFVLKSGLKFYGGFVGTETDLRQRDILAHPSLLSGNIGDPADSTDNAYTILYMAYPDTSTLVDGFTFRHGYARSDTNFIQTSPVRSGAAVYVLAKSGKGMPRFAHCTFRDNYAQNFGGAYFVHGQNSSGSTPVFQNCTFFNNKAGVSGGAVYVSGGNSYDRGIEFERCKFDLNACSGGFGNGNGGGSVFMSNSFGPEELNFWGCEATRNKAEAGSFLYLYRAGTNPVRLNIDSCYIASNFSSYSTIEWDGLPNVRQTMLRVKRSTFMDEFADNSLFWLPSTLPNNSPLFDSVDIVDNVFSQNKSSILLDFHSFHCILNIKNNLFVQGGQTGFLDVVIRAWTTNIEISNNTFIGSLTPIGVQMTTRPNAYLLIEGNLFYENKKAIIIDVYHSNISPDLAPAHIVNNVFVNNVVAPFWGSDNPSRNLVSNNVFIGNKSEVTGLPTLPLRMGLDTFVFMHNLFDTSSYCTDFPNVTCGPNNLFNLAPLFRDTANHDYSLLPCSPLINAGSNAAAMGILTDLAGNPRIQGGTVDIGAYEAPAFSLAAEPMVVPACAGDSNGSISVSPVFGCEPYSYDWSPAAGNGAELNGLPPGNYLLTITDGSGRQILDTVSVSEAPVPVLNPVATDVQCGTTLGGSIAANVSGGTAPFQYQWLPNAADTSNLGHLSPGAYALTVVDANGCQDSASTSIALLGMLTLMVDGQAIPCFGETGWLSATPVTGATPFSWDWLGWAGTDSIAQPLGPGLYAVTVADAFGCTAAFSFPYMNQPDSLWATVGTQAQTDPNMPNGAAVVTTISGGMAPYGFDWSTGSTQQAISGLTAGAYMVTVTDKNGCEAVVEVLVDPMIVGTEDVEGQAFVVYPNPAVDWVKVIFYKPYPGAVLELSDGSGRVLRSTALADGAAFGTVDLSGLPGGNYVVVVRNGAGAGIFVGKVVKK